MGPRSLRNHKRRVSLALIWGGKRLLILPIRLRNHYTLYEILSALARCMGVFSLKGATIDG